MPSSHRSGVASIQPHRVWLGVASGLLLLMSGCRDAVTSPAEPRFPTARGALSDALEPPPSGSAELTVGGASPLEGDVQFVAHYSYPTIVAMDVHQHFGISMLPPFPPGTGELGLAGRVSDFGCTHQGEAYLISIPDGGGFGFSFSGCQLASDRTRTTFSDTIEVNGTVKYGYSYDSPCPPPDNGCATYSGSSGVHLTPLSASLAITSDNLHDGELWAWPGHEYTVVAAPMPARMGRFQTPVVPSGSGWSFKPDTGTEQPDFCLDGSGRSCDVTFKRSGSLTLTAIVNGVEMVSPPLHVQMPAVSVAVSDTSVSVGDTIFLTTSLRGADASILTGYYAGITASGSGSSQAGSPVANATADGSIDSGLPPCLGTQPVPLHCYIVMTAPGRALVGVSARIDRTYFGDYKYVTVHAAGRKVSLQLSASAITPTVRYWDYHVKTRTYTLKPDRRPDTSRTTLTVAVRDEAGNPLPNVQVSVHLVAKELTSGHEHVGGKPTGILQTLAKEPIADGRIDTGPSGVAKVLFVASEVSGPVTIIGESTNASTDSAIVSVRVTGLVPLAPGAHYAYTGAIEGQHTDNHYGVPAALAAFQELADSVSAWTGQPLGINDISLRDGGLFDVGPTPWDIPHGYHRKGNHADIRIYFANGSVFPDSLKANIGTAWRLINTKHNKKNKSNIVPEGDHLHVQWYP